VIKNPGSPINVSTNEYLSIPMLAALSSETEFAWRKRIFKRQIPFVKFGSNVRVSRQDFDAWVAARMIAATATKTGGRAAAVQQEGRL
jgi:hypothetical protein